MVYIYVAPTYTYDSYLLLLLLYTFLNLEPCACDTCEHLDLEHFSLSYHTIPTSKAGRRVERGRCCRVVRRPEAHIGRVLGGRVGTM